MGDASAPLAGGLNQELQSRRRLGRRDVKALGGYRLAAMLDAAVPRNGCARRGQPLVHRVLYIVVPYDGEGGWQIARTGTEHRLQMRASTSIVVLVHRMQFAA